MSGRDETRTGAAPPRLAVGRRPRAATAIANVLAVTAIGVACARPAPPTVARTIEGEKREGRFISPYAYTHYVRAELAASRGELESAAAHLAKLRTSVPDDPLVNARYANVLDQLGDRARADEILERALEETPQAEAIHLARARIAQRRGKLDLALAAYEHAQRVAPRSDEAPLALARLLHENGARARAETVLRDYARRAGGGTPGSARARLELALVRDDAEAAAEAVEQLLRVAPAQANRVERAVRLAWSEQRPIIAAEMLEHLPAGHITPTLRIRVLLDAGRDAAAERVLATTPPEQLGGMARKAELWLEADHPARAEELAEAAIAAGQVPPGWQIAGRAELARERWVQAAAHFARVPPGARGWADARQGLARALHGGGLGRLGTETLAYARRVSEPRAPLRLRKRLANARWRQQDDLRGALALLQGDSPRLRAARARVLEQAGQLTRARKLWETIDPDAQGLRPPARARARAEQHVVQDEPQAAITVLQRYTRSHPEALWERTRLAELLYEHGQAPEAHRVARRLRTLSADSAIRKRLQMLLSEDQ